MKSHEYEYKSYIKYKGYKYIKINFLYTINWISTKTISYTREYGQLN